MSAILLRASLRRKSSHAICPVSAVPIAGPARAIFSVPASTDLRPGQQGFALKVAISDSNNTEHFWLKDIDQAGSGYTGTIDNTPRSVTHVEFGQRYTFPRKDISDWMYRQNGKIFGGYTIRVLLKMIPKSEAERLKAMLAFQPE